MQMSLSVGGRSTPGKRHEWRAMAEPLRPLPTSVCGWQPKGRQMRGKPFEPGNKMGKGRPPGSRNQRTVFSQMMDSHGEALIKQCQVLALKGDPTALRLCLERLLPPCKPSNNRFLLPAVKTASD